MSLFDFSKFEENVINMDKDTEIIMKALYDNKPDPITFWRLLMSDPKIANQIKLKIHNFEHTRKKHSSKKIIEYQKNRAIQDVTDKYVDRYIHRLIITNGLIVNAVKNFWIGCELKSRYTNCVGRGKWISKRAYDYYIKTGIEPYSI